jgi:F420-non-reducing hydrogenase iron-sulfur subunit
MSQPATAVKEPAPIEKPHEAPAGWEPSVLAFACHYCAFAAADLAGVMRLSYPTGVKTVRLPCTGKLDYIYVLRAFERGIDGVFVAGCLPGQCHFLEGNTNAKKRVAYLKTLLPTVGIDPARVEMFNLSAAEGPRWASFCTEFTERIRALGPSPMRAAICNADQKE